MEVNYKNVLFNSRTEKLPYKRTNSGTSMITKTVHILLSLECIDSSDIRRSKNYMAVDTSLRIFIM